MPLAQIDGLIPWPWNYHILPGGNRTNNITASGHQQAMSFPVWRSGTITGMAINILSIASSDDIDLRLEGCSAGGSPDGTVKVNVGDVAVNVATPATGWTEHDFDNDFDVTIGDQPLSLVVRFGGDTTVSGDISFAVRGHDGFYLPASWHNTGSWSTDNSDFPPFAIKWSDGYHQQPWAGSAIFHSVQNTSSLGSLEMGLKFEVPFTGRLVGMWCDIRQLTNTNNATFQLYDDASIPGNGTLIGTMDDLYTPTNNNIRFVAFDTPQTLVPGTTYRLTFIPGGSTYMSRLEFINAGFMNLAKGDGLYHYCISDGGGTPAWVDTGDSLIQMPPWVLLFDQLDDGTGSGGDTIIFNQLRYR